MDEAYNSIRQQYKDIILTEIDSAFRKLYDAYESMYSLVTNPSGFAINIQDRTNKMVNSNESISLFLDE